AFIMETEYSKIVVAVGGSDDSDKAFNKAVAMANRHDATLVLTHVVDTSTYATLAEYDKVIVNRAKEFGEEILDKYEQNTKDANIEDLKILMKEGRPKSVITREIAPEEDADLIIVGATGLNAVERFLIGSVSESIIRNAKCDVLVVK